MESPAGPPRARRLRVDLEDLLAAFDDASWEVSAYLDLETGEVVRITAETQQELEAIYAELPADLPDEAAYPAAFAAALERRRLPGWMDAVLREADAVERGRGARFLQLPRADSREGCAAMEAFIETVASPWLRERLRAAMRGRGAFRRFKDVLARSPTEFGRWLAFRDALLRDRVLAWLRDEGIEAVEAVG